MQVEIINNINNLLSYKREWDFMFSKKEYTFFQSFTYNYYSWKHILSLNKGNVLNIIFIRKDNKLIAILPFYIDRKKKLRFINDIHTDFCDILLEKKFNFGELISSLPIVHSYSFINLTNQSNFLNIFSVNEFKYQYTESNITRYSYIDIPRGDFPNNHAFLRSKQKSEFRRIKKLHVDSEHSTFHYENDKFPIELIKSLRIKMINLRIRDDKFLDDSLICLINDLYLKGEIIISMIKDSTGVQAISFILFNDNKYLFWIDMYDKSKMINILNYIFFITKFSKLHDVNIQFGRGDYSYKLKNFLPIVNNLNSISIFFNKFDLIFFKFYLYIIRFLKSIFKKIIK